MDRDHVGGRRDGAGPQTDPPDVEIRFAVHTEHHVDSVEAYTWRRAAITVVALWHFFQGLSEAMIFDAFPNILSVEILRTLY